jgi:hypothetical protein
MLERRRDPGMLEAFKRMWIGWNVVVRGILVVQNGVLMGTAYLLGIGPVALVLKLFRRDLLDRGPAARGAASYWRRRDGKPIDMRGATRQF